MISHIGGGTVDATEEQALAWRAEADRDQAAWLDACAYWQPLFDAVDDLLGW